MSSKPSKRPTRAPTKAPTRIPTKSPIKRTFKPSTLPTNYPTYKPTNIIASSTNRAALIGGVVGGSAGVLCILLLFCCYKGYCRKKKVRRERLALYDVHEYDNFENVSVSVVDESIQPDGRLNKYVRTNQSIPTASAVQWDSTSNPIHTNVHTNSTSSSAAIGYSISNTYDEETSHPRTSAMGQKMLDAHNHEHHDTTIKSPLRSEPDHSVDKTGLKISPSITTTSADQTKKSSPIIDISNTSPYFDRSIIQSPDAQSAPLPLPLTRSPPTSTHTTTTTRNTINTTTDINLNDASNTDTNNDTQGYIRKRRLSAPLISKEGVYEIDRLVQIYPTEDTTLIIPADVEGAHLSYPSESYVNLPEIYRSTYQPDEAIEAPSSDRSTHISTSGKGLTMLNNTFVASNLLDPESVPLPKPKPDKGDFMVHNQFVASNLLDPSYGSGRSPQPLSRPPSWSATSFLAGKKSALTTATATAESHEVIVKTDNERPQQDDEVAKISVDSILVSQPDPSTLETSTAATTAETIPSAVEEVPTTASLSLDSEIDQAMHHRRQQGQTNLRRYSATLPTDTSPQHATKPADSSPGPTRSITSNPPEINTSSSPTRRNSSTTRRSGSASRRTDSMAITKAILRNDTETYVHQAKTLPIHTFSPPTPVESEDTSEEGQAGTATNAPVSPYISPKKAILAASKATILSPNRGWNSSTNAASARKVACPVGYTSLGQLSGSSASPRFGPGPTVLTDGGGGEGDDRSVTSTSSANSSVARRSGVVRVTPKKSIVDIVDYEKVRW